jgi:hypothetical protein
LRLIQPIVELQRYPETFPFEPSPEAACTGEVGVKTEITPIISARAKKIPYTTVDFFCIGY